MIREHFGLTHLPLGKATPVLRDDGQLSTLKERALLTNRTHKKPGRVLPTKTGGFSLFA
jgi:hypothetical protein